MGMVSRRQLTQVLALTKTGLKDWVLQRVSAVVIFLYAVFLTGFFWSHPSLSPQDWMALFAHPWMKIVSLFVLILMLVHARIGIWIVLTDYIHKSCVRTSILFLIFLVFFACFIWGVLTLWG
jgi:succinate dehydrogenase / fumarate reductase, membrane anchor subunit